VIRGSWLAHRTAAEDWVDASRIHRQERIGLAAKSRRSSAADFWDAGRFHSVLGFSDMEQRAPQILIQQGRKARHERRLEDARSSFREALEQCGCDDDPRLVAELHAELAYVERALHDEQSAEAHYRRAAEMFRALGDQLRTAHNVRHLADILRETGRPLEAAPFYAESIEFFRRSGEYPLQLANALRGLALMQGDLGDFAGSLQSWAEAKALYQMVNVDSGVAESRNRIDELMAHR
jgi:tetratricopeptide (TPR) repeat protein